jgi:hypothetical protein
VDDDAIKLEMRISAIEYLLCKMHLVTLLASGAVRPETFDEFAEGFVAGAAQQKFPVPDAALSDHLSGEWEEAIARLLRLEKTLLEQTMSGRSR